MKHLVLTALYSIGILGFFLPPALEAKECRRGALDRKFCDQNGDLLADAPTDQSLWIDPKVIIFSYTPVEDPAVYRDVWDAFVKHMEKVTGRQVRFFAVESNAAQIETMRAGRLHVSGFNTGSNPLAVNCAGFIPFAMMAAQDGSYGYQMELITYPGSRIEKIEDIRGKAIAFSSPTSNSGFKAPTAILQSDYGMVVDRDYSTTFSGKHDNTILGVVNKDYVVGAVGNNVLRRMVERGAVKKDQYRSIYKSQTFPSTAFGHVFNLHPALAKKVREAFFTFPWEGSKLAEEFKADGNSKFIPIEYQNHWAVIRKIDQATGVKYSCQ